MHCSAFLGGRLKSTPKVILWYFFVWFGLISSYFGPLNTENITWVQNGLIWFRLLSCMHVVTPCYISLTFWNIFLPSSAGDIKHLLTLNSYQFQLEQTQRTGLKPKSSHHLLANSSELIRCWWGGAGCYGWGSLLFKEICSNKYVQRNMFKEIWQRK